MTYLDPWPVLLPALGALFTVVIAVELVVALVKGALRADEGGEL